jgi:hypothetical protein
MGYATHLHEVDTASVVYTILVTDANNGVFMSGEHQYIGQPTTYAYTRTYLVVWVHTTLAAHINTDMSFFVLCGDNAVGFASACVWVRKRVSSC